MKALRITYILPVYWPAIGGCELHTHELVKRLSEKHEINVVTLINNQEDKLSHELWMACILKAPGKPVEYQDNRAKVTRLALSTLEKFMNYPLARVQSPKLPVFAVRLAMERLSNFYKQKLINLVKGADILHCIHGGISYLGYAALKAARDLDIPFIYTPVLHLYHKDWLNEMKKCKAENKPFVYAPQLHIISRSWTDPFWYKLCCEADRVVTMTDFEKDFFIREGIAAEHLHRIGVGPLLSDYAAGDTRQKYGVADKKIVLFLGRNVAYKGIEELLLAAQIVWKTFPETYFFFAGPKEANSETIFKIYDDPRVKVLGFVSDNEKTSLLRDCDIFCMPSLEESLGGSFLEAWAFGKPVIGARIPPLVEITNNGEGGFLVDPDPADIAEKIMILLKDPGLGKSMGLWGKRRVSEQYSWEIITEKMERLYSNVIK